MFPEPEIAGQGVRFVVHVSGSPSNIELLFPLNGGRRFGGDIVHHPVDSVHFIDDPVGDPLECVMWNSGPVSGHAINRRNRPDADRIGIGAGIPHDTHTSEVREGGEVLPDLAVQSCFLDFIPQDRIRFPDDFQLLLRHFTDHANPQPGPGKGWRQTISRGSPSSSPTLRTSSLNKVLTGSTRSICISSGKPPTLWWDLMV